MRQRERYAIYEAGALALAGFGLAFAVPTLVSAHDSVALLAGGMLMLAWGVWMLWFAYRVTKGDK
jgi:hypothetical protein